MIKVSFTVWCRTYISLRLFTPARITMKVYQTVCQCRCNSFKNCTAYFDNSIDIALLLFFILFWFVSLFLFFVFCFFVFVLFFVLFCFLFCFFVFVLICFLVYFSFFIIYISYSDPVQPTSQM